MKKNMYFYLYLLFKLSIIQESKGTIKLNDNEGISNKIKFKIKE